MTEELLLGLPPMNLGDLLATDLRDLFLPTYNRLTANMVPVNRKIDYVASPEGLQVWSLVSQLNPAELDKDSRRLGTLGWLSPFADDLHAAAALADQLNSPSYKDQQEDLYQQALQLFPCSKSPRTVHLS